MLKTLGIVEVAPVDSRLDESCLDIGQLASTRFGGTSLLEWVLRRVTDSQCLGGVITILERSVAKQVAHLVPPDVPVLDSSERSSLERILEAVERFPARSIVRVGLRTPLIDPELIDRLVSAADHAPECDYITYRSTVSEMSTVSQLGLVGQWCRAIALQRARKSVESIDDLDLSDFVARNQSLFRTQLLRLPNALDRDDIRLTLSVRTDLENVEAIYDALGPDHLDWQRIATLLDQQPAMRQQMASLNRAEVSRS